MKIDVKVSGPLFEKGGGAPVRTAIERTVADLVESGAETARRLASPHRKSGRYIDSLKGKVSKTKRSGRVKAYGGPRRMPYAAVHERGRYWPGTGSRFAGHKVLARAAAETQQKAPAVLRRNVDKAVKELGG